MMATQEYGGLRDQLDLEQSLRVEAETFAHEVRQRTRVMIAWSVTLMIIGRCSTAQSRKNLGCDIAFLQAPFIS